MHDLERIRAYVAGTLPPDERDAFAERLRAEPELAELAEAYGLVVEATAHAAPADAATASSTSFEELDLATAPVHGHATGARVPWRTVAVAALLLLALATALWIGARDGGPVPASAVRVASIPLEYVPVPDKAPWWPRSLKGYVHADEEGLVWNAELEDAQAIARYTDRPVFVFLDYPGCPLCKQLEEEHFKDDGVIAASEPFLLVKMSWGKAPDRLRADPRKGWPIFHVLDPKGDRYVGFTGMKKPEELAAWFERVRDRLREKGGLEFRPIEPLQELAVKLDRAERTDDAGERLALLEEVAAAEPEGALGADASARIARLERDAQLVLFAARNAKDPVTVLEHGIARLLGTPYAADLQRVRDHIETFGEYPLLER